MESPGKGPTRLLSIVTRSQLPRMLRFVLDEAEFLSPYGIRALSRVHREHPYVLRVDGREYRVDYEPAESSSDLFGGNSNWRGPVWFPVNHLLIESLQKLDHFYRDSMKVPCPTGSGPDLTLWRSASICRDGSAGSSSACGRPAPGVRALRDVPVEPHWRDLILFHEYFDGDTGAGLGAGRGPDGPRSWPS